MKMHHNINLKSIQLFLFTNYYFNSIMIINIITLLNVKGVIIELLLFVSFLLYNKCDFIIINRFKLILTVTIIIFIIILFLISCKL